MKPPRTLKSAKRRAWAVYSEWVRRSAAVDDMVKCVTCGINKHWKEMHAGHFIAHGGGNGVFIVDDPCPNVHPQCPYCNTYLHGNLVPYTTYMLDHYGRAAVETLQQMKKQPRKMTIDEWYEIEKRYVEELDALQYHESAAFSGVHF